MTRSLLLILAATFAAACSSNNGTYSKFAPKVDLETSSRENQKILDDQHRDAGPLAAVVAMGKRNLDWLDHINSLLPADKKLSFSNKSNMTGIPIDKPARYSDKIVLKRFDDMKTQIPKEMYAVIFDNQPFTDTPPIDTQAYLDWGLKVDKLYQTATRWLMMVDYLDELALRRVEDVRGYYFLNKEDGLNDKLSGFKTLSVEDHDRLKQWLLMICYNSTASDDVCNSQLQTAEDSGAVLAYFNKYNPAAKHLWDRNFEIQGFRSDIDWTSAHENVLNFPFRDPGTDKIRDYLKVNIEDEWKWNGWNLVINFDKTAATHIIYQAGVLPHVNGIAGNEITMDQNALLTEWDVQWTIRHEFGHVLGFPDCYVEFYEPSSGEMVDYQLDVTNLMCSRQGRLQERHFTELKKAYYKAKPLDGTGLLAQ